MELYRRKQQEIDDAKIDTKATATEWTSFPLVIKDANGTNVMSGSPIYSEAKWRRVGDSMEIAFRYYHQTTVGTNGVGLYTVTLPDGYVVDDTKALLGAGNSNNAYGIARGDIGGASHTTFVATPDSGGTNEGATFQSSTSSSSWNAVFFNMGATYVAISGTFKLPIVGWE